MKKEGHQKGEQTRRTVCQIIQFPKGTNLSNVDSLSNTRGEGKKKKKGGREKMRASGLATACTANLFPAGAGNEEIGSHQNMQCLSSQAHLS